MDADTLLIKAKSFLTNKYPYFGMLASRLKQEPNEEIETFASNGKKFIYNSKFIENCTQDELVFILTNCAMHHILSHQQRKLARKGFLWQLATDFAINNLLFKNGMKIPQGANFDKKYKNMYAEEIYEALKEEYNSSPSAFDDDTVSKTNNKEDENEQKSKNLFANIKNIEVDLDEKIEDEWQYADSIAKEVAKRKSLVPLGFERFAKKSRS